jgi:hypothetical protein
VAYLRLDLHTDSLAWDGQGMALSKPTREDKSASCQRKKVIFCGRIVRMCVCYV